MKRIMLLAILFAFALVRIGETQVRDRFSARGRPAGIETPQKTLKAVNDTAMIELEGQPYVGITLTRATSFSGVVITEFSTDNQATWDERWLFHGDACSEGDKLPHAVEDRRDYIVATYPSDTHVRIRVLTYTSDSAFVRLRATATAPPPAMNRCAYQSIPTTLDTLNEALEVSVGAPAVGFFVDSGAVTGAVTVEASPVSHGNNWPVRVSVRAQGLRLDSLISPASGLVVSVPVTAGFRRLRFRISSWSAGGLRVQARASDALDAYVLLPQANGMTQIASGTADVEPAIAAATGLKICGFSAKENAGTPAAAEFSLVIGATVGGGTQINGLHFDLAANGQVTEWFGPDCLAVPAGLSIDRVAGTTKFTLFTKIVP